MRVSKIITGALLWLALLSSGLADAQGFRPGRAPSFRAGFPFLSTAPVGLPQVSVAPIYVRANVKLIATYSGPAVQRASDSANLSFADVAALSAVTPISKAYDQSGSGNDAVQATANARPALSPFGKIGGAPSLAMMVPYSATQQYLSLPSSLAVDRQSYSAFFVIWPTVTYTGASVWSFGTSTGLFQESGGAKVYTGSAGTSSGKYLRAQPQVIGVTSGAGGLRVWLRDTSVSLSALTASALTGGADGWFQGFGGYPPASYSAAMVVYPTALSQADAQKVVDALASIYGVETSFSKRVLFDGDSLMAGSVANTQGSLPGIIPSLAWPAGIERQNFGVAGQYESQAQSQFATRFNADLSAAAGITAFYFVEANGTNDLGAGGQTDTQLAATDDAMLASLRSRAAAQGITLRVGIATITPRNDTNWNATKEGYRQTINARRRALTGGNGQAWDFCIDVDKAVTDAGISTTNSAYYFTDQLHWTRLMYDTIVGPKYQSALQAQGAM